MRSRIIITCILFLAFFLSISMLFSGIAEASGEDAAKFDRIEITPSPEVQGIGGAVKLEVKAYFFGGCCYHLFARDVEASIEAPGLQVVSTPAVPRYDEVDGIPGGEPVTADFVWELSTLNVGEFLVNVTVSTSNCGVKEGSVSLIFREGCSISNPVLYPSHPEKGSDISVTTLVKHALEGKNTREVAVFYYNSNGENMVLDNGTLMDEGRSVEPKMIIALQDSTDQDMWRMSIPGKGLKGMVHYYIRVEDNTGNFTYSSLYSFEITDVIGARNQAFAIISIWLILSIIIIVMLIWVGKRQTNIPGMEGQQQQLAGKKDGFVVMGGGRMDLIHGEKGGDYLRYKKMEMGLRIALALLFLSFIIIGFITDSYTELMDHIMNGG